jgi:hypothetical protein
MIETFTNDYGEKLWFSYNEENDMGTIWNSDDKYKYFYVFDGLCLFLNLIPKEQKWLNDIWNKYSKHKNTYLNFNTDIKFNNKTTYLTNNFCPVCLQQKREFENHHCVPSSEGGSDDYVNILNICNSCHSLITNGCYEDKYPRYLTAIYHQSYFYGIDFYKMNPENNQRFKKDMGLYKHRPFIKKIINDYEKLTEEEQNKFNEKAKQTSLYYYKYYRSIVKNLIKEVT